MKLKWIVVLVAASALAAAPLLPRADGSRSDEIQLVHVTNFPETQTVDGSVSVVGPVHLASALSIREIDVPPLVAPHQIRRLVPAGTVTTDGFGAVVLSLTGQSRGFVSPGGGEVGAILLPDEELVLRAMEEKGDMQFPLEVKAPVAGGQQFFHSGQPRHQIGFPRYRVFLYNTSDKTATVDLHAYLTH